MRGGGYEKPGPGPGPAYVDPDYTNPAYAEPVYAQIPYFALEVPATISNYVNMRAVSNSVYNRLQIPGQNSNKNLYENMYNRLNPWHKPTSIVKKIQTSLIAKGLAQPAKKSLPTPGKLLPKINSIVEQTRPSLLTLPVNVQKIVTKWKSHGQRNNQRTRKDTTQRFTQTFKRPK